MTEEEIEAKEAKMLKRAMRASRALGNLAKADVAKAKKKIA